MNSSCPFCSFLDHQSLVYGGHLTDISSMKYSPLPSVLSWLQNQYGSRDGVSLVYSVSFSSSCLFCRQGPCW
jgi:uncharacterized membrane protein